MDYTLKEIALMEIEYAIGNIEFTGIMEEFSHLTEDEAREVLALIYTTSFEVGTHDDV